MLIFIVGEASVSITHHQCSDLYGTWQ